MQQKYFVPAGFSVDEAKRQLDDNFGILTEFSRRFILARLSLLDERVRQAIALLGADPFDIESIKNKFVIHEFTQHSLVQCYIVKYKVVTEPEDGRYVDFELTQDSTGDTLKTTATEAVLHQ